MPAPSSMATAARNPSRLQATDSTRRSRKPTHPHHYGEHYDVSNLVSQSTKRTTLVAKPSGPQDDFARGAAAVIGPSTWSSGRQAARRLKRLSGEGRSPIATLCLGGHCFAGGALSGENGSGPFSAADVFREATETNNRNNTYSSASTKKGPPKCWFTPNAKFYGYGCNTSGAWAASWRGIARKNATVHGTRKIVFAGWNNGNPFATFEPENPPLAGTIKYRNLDGLLSAPDWLGSQGTQ